jgi:hypothetical protein
VFAEKKGDRVYAKVRTHFKSGGLKTPAGGSDIANQKTENGCGLKMFPIGVSVENRQIHA